MPNISKTSNGFISNRAWFRDVLGGEDLVLCHTSALECLQLFSGYINESEIDVYAKMQGAYDNINYRIVNSFDNLEVTCIGNLKCTSFNQTINDMLKNYDNTDEQALTEALSKYYYMNDNSFRGLVVKDENEKVFNFVKNHAIDYYDEG